MNHKQMAKVMENIMKQVGLMRDEGQKEYAHDDNDVFANFNRISHLLGVDRKKVLMTYMLKHVDGVAAYVKGHKSQREDVTGRITDIIVYLMLLWAMIEEEDGLVFRKKDDSPLSNVLETIHNENRRISMEGRRKSSNGYKSDSDMQEVCEERNGIEVLEEMGTDK